MYNFERYLFRIENTRINEKMYTDQTRDNSTENTVTVKK